MKDLSNLTITRELGEAFYIGDDIVIRLLERKPNMRGRGIRVMITAPRDVKILREELYIADKQAANQSGDSND